MESRTWTLAAVPLLRWIWHCGSTVPAFSVVCNISLILSRGFYVEKFWASSWKGLWFVAFDSCLSIRLVMGFLAKTVAHLIEKLIWLVGEDVFCMEIRFGCRALDQWYLRSKYWTRIQEDQAQTQDPRSSGVVPLRPSWSTATTETTIMLRRCHNVYGYQFRHTRSWSLRASMTASRCRNMRTMVSGTCLLLNLTCTACINDSDSLHQTTMMDSSIAKFQESHLENIKTTIEETTNPFENLLVKCL